MKVRRTIVLALALGLACAVPVRAGVYNTADPDPPVLSPHFRIFQDTLVKLRQITNQDVSTQKLAIPLRENYLFIAGLAPANAAVKLTWQQRLNLSACLIRLQKPQEAIEILKPAAAEERDNFLIQSNLATAYHLAGLESRALDCMSVALRPSMWPSDESKLPKPLQQAFLQIGQGKKTASWYRKVDSYYKKLIGLRLREGFAQNGKPAGLPTSVDALFDDGGKPPQPLQFIGESGKYEPGKLAVAEQAKLPKDAIEIVEQLLVWLPNDPRLYWLLGELLNARGDATEGDVDTATAIFNELLDWKTAKARYKDLVEHQRVLRDRPQAAAPVPVAADEPPVKSPSPAKLDEPWSPDPWQTLGIGFVAGILVTFLGYWQVREIVRRRQQRAVASRR